MDYYRQKALRAKELYDKGLPFVKVYAPVRVGDEFMVLKRTKGNEIYYDIAGGGVDEGETLEQAIKRELKEELNVEVDVIKELGVYNDMIRTWKLDDFSFDIRYEIHVFDTRLKKTFNGEFGLDGEFNRKTTSVAKIDKQTLIENVPEFKDFGIKID